MISSNRGSNDVLGKALASLDGLLLPPALSRRSTMDKNSTNVPPRVPWNKGKIVGQKAPLKPKDMLSLL